MEYIFQKLSSRLIWARPSFVSTVSTMRKWAVELTGKNSVKPSTTPSRMEIRQSRIILCDRCQLGFNRLGDELDERAEPSWPVMPVIRAVFGFRSIKSPFVQHQSAKAIVRTR